MTSLSGFLIKILQKVANVLVAVCGIHGILSHPSPPITFDRSFIARMFLTGEGLEIGALHVPLDVPDTVKVNYVDRFSREDLRKHYPELQDQEFVDVDIIND